MWQRSSVQNALLAILSFSLSHLCVRELAEYPIHQLVFFRGLFSFITCYILIRRLNLNWKGNNKKLLFIRGILGVSSLFLFFFTIGELPLGSAVTLANLKPLLIILLAVPLLKESLKPVQLIFFLIAFTGVWLIKGFDSRVSTIGMLAAIGAVLFSAMAHIVLKKLKDYDHPFVILFFFGMVSLIITIPLCFHNWIMPKNLLDWGLFLLLGLFTQLGQILITYAYHQDRMANISSFSFLSVFLSMIYGYYLYNETYNNMAIIGILLITGGVVMNYLYRRIQKGTKL